MTAHSARRIPRSSASARTGNARRRIIAYLAGIEKAEGVRVLYACESGSRAWGFPSADSDYDVRFIYLHPRDWYLSIDLERRPDVIERPIADALDVNGWDLRKALQLFRKCNPPLMEWLGSPIVYYEESSVAGAMRSLAPEFYSPRACLYHYWHMAQGNYRDYLHGKRVWVKKYFYVLRPLLAVRWIERGLGVVPTEFARLVEATIEDPALKRAIGRLIAAKRGGAELARGRRIEVISRFIEEEMRGRPRPTDEPESHRPPVERLNDLFRVALEEVWG